MALPAPGATTVSAVPLVAVSYGPACAWGDSFQPNSEYRQTHNTLEDGAALTGLIAGNWLEKILTPLLAMTRMAPPTKSWRFSMTRLILAVVMVAALSAVFIAAAPAQKEDNEDNTARHGVECSARSDIFPTSGNSLMATSRSNCSGLAAALSIDADIYLEDPNYDVVTYIGSYGDGCVVCRNLLTDGEEFGLTPGRYSVTTLHRMTAHGEEASITSYDATQVP